MEATEIKERLVPAVAVSHNLISVRVMHIAYVSDNCRCNQPLDYQNTGNIARRSST